jgi:hypothetical protein
VRKLWYSSALLGVATVSSGLTAAFLPRSTVVVPATPVTVKAAPARLALPKRVAGTAPAPKQAKTEAKTVKKVVAKPRPAATHITHGSTVTPSLYEATTSVSILRAQGCRAGRARTNGLVVLDFGKLAYYPRRGGYGTITFADRFASNRSVTWAGKSFAHGYSECLPAGSRSHITLALGTSNYSLDVPSTFTAGRLWAKDTELIGRYIELHHLDHVAAAAGDDVEPAWDRTFLRTYGFFRGYGSTHTKYLIYNYGSLDGGVGAIWKLRQAYYVAGGMYAARAIPEIYNRSMAKEWAELARLSVKRYGKSINLAGLMTQHTSHCRRCGYTAAQAHKALVGELAKHPKTKVRRLAAATNIGSPAPVSKRDLQG